MAQLEGILTELQKQLVAIDAEKSDAAAALACAALVQQEALAAAAGGAGAAAGAEQGSAQAAAEDGTAGLSPNGAAAADAPAAPAAEAHGPSAVLEWAADVCRGAAAGTAGAAGAAGEQPAPAGEDAAAEALHWSHFAVAPYGSRLHSWQRGKASSCAARKQLGRLAAAAAAEHAQPLAGWGSGAAVAAAAARPHKPSRAERRSFAAARELLGAGCQIVSFNDGDQKRGLLPHLVAVDR